jgi:hypothetical protein
MELKGLKRGTTFSIEISSYSKWILNENSENLLILNLNRIWSESFLESSIWVTLGPETYICT